MSSQKSQLQRVIREYKIQTGATEIDMHDVARFAVTECGWRLPEPVDPYDRLARQLSKAARDEMRQDTATGRPYRANHAVTETRGGRQMTLWVDIDEAPRPRMVKSLIQRREQMVGDAVQLTFDAEHWNSVHPDEEPITMELDFTEDVEWRKNSEASEKAS